METRDDKKRCFWADNDVLTGYHDNEYGKIKTDDSSIFAKLCLEVFAQGRYYTEVLEARDAIAEELYGFDIDKCAALTDEYLNGLLARPKSKRELAYAVRHNARCCQEIRNDYGSLFKFVYSFKQPERLYAALQKYGFQQIREENISWLMKNIGVIEAHEPECFMYSRGKEDTP